MTDLIGDHGIDVFLFGLSCTSVRKAEYSWHLIFGEGKRSLNLECPWRLLVGGSIAFGDEDNGQQFGLPAAVDGRALIRRLLATSTVISVGVTATADVTVGFENGAELQAFNHSGGYEAWTVSDADPFGFLAVAQGGGRLEIFDAGEKKSRSGLSSRYGSAELTDEPRST
jgi:hypothetical protein